MREQQTVLQVYRDAFESDMKTLSAERPEGEKDLCLLHQRTRDPAQERRAFLRTASRS